MFVKVLKSTRSAYVGANGGRPTRPRRWRSRDAYGRAAARGRRANSAWLAAAGAMMVMVTWVGTSQAQDPGEGSFFDEMGRASSLGGGVVSSGHREASAAGLAILNKGGNAIDAAAATMFAVGVASFNSCGIGGGGFLVYRSAQGETAALDFREWSPKEYKFTAGTSIGLVFHWGTGHNVVGIPGAVAGMDAALERFGTMSLAKVLAPGEALARNGFTVERRTAALMRDPNEAARLSAFPNTARQYEPAVIAEAAGEKFTLPELAEDYRELAALGARAFYDPRHKHGTGTIARDLLAEMARESTYAGDKATWNESDLRNYEAIWRTPVSTTYRGAEVIGMPAPSSAGATIAQMLNILEGFPDLPATGQRSADRFHLVAEAQKLAWIDRNKHLADPAFSPTPSHLITKAYADEQRARIDRDQAQTFEAQVAVDDGGTHNLAVIDKWGNAASINCSIERSMGSAVVAHGTGFLLNNQLTDFEGSEGPPLAAAGPANGWAPRKRPRSSMAPTIVVRDGRPVLVTGGIGGPNIIGATANIALNVLDFGQDVAHAVDAPRGEARGLCTATGLQLCLEEARIDGTAVTTLGEWGHTLTNYRAWGDWACSAPPNEPALGKGCEYSLIEYNHAAGVNPDTARTEAATDSRLMAAGNVTTAQGAVAQPDP